MDELQSLASRMTPRQRADLLAFARAILTEPDDTRERERTRIARERAWEVSQMPNDLERGRQGRCP